MENQLNDIELRSQKVRNIIGTIPPILLRIGISIISLVMLLFLMFAYFMPYPKYLSLSVELYCEPSYVSVIAPEDGTLNLYSDNDIDVKKGDKIAFFEGIDSTYYYVASLDGKLIGNTDNINFFKKGNILYSIIPVNIESLYGVCYINEEEKQKVKIGQQVNFDSLTGKVIKIYPLPELYGKNEQRLYKIGVSFENIDNYDFIPYNVGKASLLISDKSILKQLFNL